MSAGGAAFFPRRRHPVVAGGLRDEHPVVRPQVPGGSPGGPAVPEDQAAGPGDGAVGAGAARRRAAGRVGAEGPRAAGAGGPGVGQAPVARPVVAEAAPGAPGAPAGGVAVAAPGGGAGRRGGGRWRAGPGRRPGQVLDTGGPRGASGGQRRRVPSRGPAAAHGPSASAAEGAKEVKTSRFPCYSVEKTGFFDDGENWDRRHRLHGYEAPLNPSLHEETP